MVLFVDSIAVIGAGTMGARIAEVFALNGKRVLLNDVKPEFMEKGLASAKASLDGLAKFHATKVERAVRSIENDHGIRLTDEQKKAVAEKNRPTYTPQRVADALARIEPATDLKQLKDVDLVVEAVVEDPKIKHDLFRKLGSIVQSRAVFATNTSALPVSPMGQASGRPERFLGMHFFNPPTTLPLVEIIAGQATSEETVSDVVNVLASMRNHRYPMLPIQVKECPGFLVNRILGAMLQEAYRCLEENVASARDIDNAMKAGAGLPMGPLELSDMIGLDVIQHAHRNVDERLPDYEDYVEKPHVLDALVKEGRLGRKTGKGFFDYG